MKVWQKGHLLTLDVYAATKHFPREKVYGLTSQLRRSCASIPANIAEGCGRTGDAELARFPQIAMGSASELEYHPLLAHDLDYLSPQSYNCLITETVTLKRMPAPFINKLRKP